MLYMSGIWADNAVYWTRPGGIVVAHFYRVLPAYDISKLLAYLTTIPMAAIFLVHLEAGFYRHYRSFFHMVCGESTLDEIEGARRNMIAAARTGLRKMLGAQAVIIAAAFVFAPMVVHAVKLPAGGVALLRVQLFAAPAQFLLLAGLLLLLYLDRRRSALAVAVTFAGGNAALTVATLELGTGFRGTGYLGATVISACTAFVLLRSGLRDLEYRTFMLQPA
jgi:uncharacterized membrane protein